MPRPVSALVVPVPEAEAVVGEWRERFDPTQRRGVPPHVTVLYPFIPPERIDEGTIESLRGLLAAVGPFSFTLDEVGWFDREVVWLRPAPDRPFRQLTELVVGHWPDFPPYGGTFEEIVPHLTVAREGTGEEKQRVIEAVEAKLPIPARGQEVWLMTGNQESGSWAVHTVFPLTGEDSHAEE